MNLEKLRIGMVVKRHRTNRRYTQIDLSKLTRISQSKLSRIEQGKMGLTAADAHKVMKVLKIDPSELFIGIRRKRK